MAKSSVLDLIGGTPLVHVESPIVREFTLLGKCEFMNPGGSLKDRPALHIIRQAKENGRLQEGQPVVEMTSGNMGAGLALVCAQLGHPFIAVMSAGNSEKRAEMIEAFGGQVVRIPQVDGCTGQVTGSDIKAAVKEAKKITEEMGAYYVDQFNNPNSIDAHYKTTGPEIWEQTEGKIDAFVACVGSSGSFTGISRFLKEKNPKILCFVVEPEHAAILAGEKVTNPKHIIQGTGYGVLPQHWDASLADGFCKVEDQEVEFAQMMLGQTAGLHVGYSAAANCLAASRLVHSGKIPKGAQIATLLCDTGLKY